MNEVRQGVVLAAGEGQRLRPITHTTPKPLVPFFGRPLLEWAIGKLIDAGCERIAVNAFHRADAIKAHLAELASRLPIELHLSEEPALLGTGGAIAHLRPWLDDAPFYVLNADAIFEEQVRNAFAAVAQRAPALLVTRDPRFSSERRLIMGERDLLSHLEEQSAPSGFTFCGLTLADSDLPQRLPRGPSCILRQGFLPFLDSLPVTLVETRGFFADTGTPESLLDAHRRGLAWVASLPHQPIGQGPR